MSLLYSFTGAGKAPGGTALQFPDVIEPVVPSREVGSTTTAGLTANTVYLWRFRVARPITIANAKVYNGATVAGNLALGIYTESGGTWTLVANTADTAASGANAPQVVPLAAAYTLVPGVDYWAAFGGTNATYTILRGVSMVSAGLSDDHNMSLLKAAVYSSGLPATIVTPVGNAIPFYLAFST